MIHEFSHRPFQLEAPRIHYLDDNGQKLIFLFGFHYILHDKEVCHQ